MIMSHDWLTQLHTTSQSQSDFTIANLSSFIMIQSQYSHVVWWCSRPCSHSCLVSPRCILISSRLVASRPYLSLPCSVVTNLVPTLTILSLTSLGILYISLASLPPLPLSLHTSSSSVTNNQLTPPLPSFPNSESNHHSTTNMATSHWEFANSHSRHSTHWSTSMWINSTFSIYSLRLSMSTSIWSVASSAFVTLPHAIVCSCVSQSCDIIMWLWENFSSI